MSKCVLTHRGWFLVCPVYVGNLDTDCPVLEPRRPWLAWLEDVSIVLFDVAVALRQCVDPAYEADFPIILTGGLEEPIELGDEEC